MAVTSSRGPDPGDELTDALVEVRGDLIERVGLFGKGHRRGVRDAPVSRGRSAGELGAHLTHLVAQGDHVIEALAPEPVERLRAVARDVDAALGHDPHGSGVEGLRMAT